MPPTPIPERRSSLLLVTVRRTLVLGRFFLAYGTVMSVLLGTALALTAGPSFASAFPVLLPIFGAVGSMGALTVFTSDRTRGTIEYFLAYGVSSRRIFANVLIACVVTVTILLSVGVGVGLALYLGRGYPVTDTLVLGMGFYGVPMSYVSAAFATIAGMYWSGLSSPSTAMNSPIGLAPLIGILPPVLVLIIITVLGITGTFSISGAFEVAIALMLVVAALTLGLLASIGRFLLPERLISSA